MGGLTVQWTRASRKSNLASPVQFDDGGGIHVQDLVRCRHIRRFIPIHYRSPCRWYLVCALRHWLGRDELRFLLISAMPRYRVGSRWILPSQYIRAFHGKRTAAALSARLLATPHWPWVGAKRTAPSGVLVKPIQLLHGDRSAIEAPRVGAPQNNGAFGQEVPRVQP